LQEKENKYPINIIESRSQEGARRKSPSRLLQIRRVKTTEKGRARRGGEYAKSAWGRMVKMGIAHKFSAWN